LTKSYGTKPARNWEHALISGNATMDIAIVKELLTNLITVCEELDIEPDSVMRWKWMLQKMPAYQINDDKCVVAVVPGELAEIHFVR
jgi:hypothetical protein